MRFHALVADYDGTLAHHGLIEDSTWAAIRRLRDSGRKLVMVTGRQLDDLLGIVPHPDLFDRIVVENGAVVYEPATRRIRALAPPPPAEFVSDLIRRGVARVSVGRVIVATWEPHQDEVFHAIHDLGLELHVIFNKGAVMVLPSGINKATGLAAALDELGLSRHNVVSVGDAENDHAMLELAECGVAVGNALGAIKSHADLVTTGDHGIGVSELIDRMIADDLASVRLDRHAVRLGKADDRDIMIDPYAANIMVCGTSGSGKSTLATGLLERFCAVDYQFAVIDPEGDYEGLAFATTIGSANSPPLMSEVLDVLRSPKTCAAINLLGVALAHRPDFFAQLMPVLAELRARSGRPHWVLVDEAHHLVPASWQPAAELPLRPHGTLYITVHPDRVARAVLAKLDTLIVVGDHVDQTVRELCAVLGMRNPTFAATGTLPPGEALYWRIGTPATVAVRIDPPETERTRHQRKYMNGNLGKDRSFYFRGPDGKLNLAAPNLQLFVHLAGGVDDDTWLFHARNHDYSRWVRAQVKDAELADEIERIERHPTPSRDAVRAAIERRYTLPADQPSGVVEPTAGAPG